MLRRGFLVLGALAALALPAHAEDCRWYVHETDPDSWIQDNGADLLVHFPGDGAASFQFIVFGVEGLPNVKRASFTDPHGAGNPSTFHFRFAEVNGRKAMIADMAFYYQACEQPKPPTLPPA
ncbi:conserved exported protein of unknown function [Aminobacter niigataensis]|nr:conserved exported protein of unknown function [Aminobacter niigataensis]